MPRKMHNKCLSLSTVAIAIIGTVPAAAQAQATDAASQETSGSEPSNTVNDIIVTANKREQKLSDVGVTITALSGETLQAQGVTDIASLAPLTPGLTYAPTPSSTPVYTIRGVGFFEPSLAAYPDVSLYLDQVPLPFPVLATHVAFDLERVEVLKGPQGTLFGNNATGGAVNMIHAKPSQTFQAGADLSYGRFNTIELNGFVSGPISDTLTARFAIRAVRGDDWQKSYTRTNQPVPPEYLAVGVPDNPGRRQDTLGSKNNTAARLTLDWKPSDRLTTSFVLTGWRDRDDPTAPQKVATQPGNLPGSTGPGGTVPANLPIFLYPVAPNNARAADWTPSIRPFSNSKYWQTSLRADYELNDDLTATSISSYASLRFLNANEYDGTALIATDLARDYGRIKTFSQEIRLANAPSNPLRWVLGGNLERSQVYEVIDYRYVDASTFYVLGLPANRYDSDQKMRNYALFGNVEYDVAHWLKLKGGVRHTWANRSTVNAGYQAPGTSEPGPFGPDAPTNFFNTIYQAVFGPQVPLVAVGDSYVIDTRVNPDGTPVDPATYLIPGPFRDKLKERNTSWSVGVDIKPKQGLLAYLNVSKGYKAGSYPTLSGVIYDAYSPVTQEKLLSVEGGIKADLFDRAVSVSGAAFYYDYQDKQTRAKFVDPIFGPLDKLVNVPQSKIKGAEAEISLRPLEGLTMTAGVTYLDAKVKKYVGIIDEAVDPDTGLRIPVTASFSGVDLPFAPDWQYSARADYNFPLSDSLGGFVGVGVNGQSKSIGILTVSEAERSVYEINARAIVNANIGIQSASGSWKAQIWGKNIFNKYYWTSAIRAYDVVIRYPARPAEYGVTLSYRF